MGTSAAEVLRLLPGMTGTGGNNAKNSPGFSGEIYGINGNGEGGKQSAVGNYSANGARDWALDITIDGAPGADPGCNCATSVNPNTEFIQEFKVLQSNFGAEHAKGPVAMSVISKQGGRDFHGSVFGYLRDYHLNSNEWFANKVGADRVKNKFIYPGFSVSGPLLIPGTDFNKNRDKVFFFAGFEYFGQTLDTGYVKSWVPTQEMRNGDFRNAAAVGTGGQINAVPNIGGGVIPGNLIDPGGQALVNQFPLPNAEPVHDGRLQLRRQPAPRPERLAGPRPSRLQHLGQHEAVHALQRAARDTALRDRPVVEERRVPGPVPVPDPRQEPVRLRHGQPDPRVRPDADQRDDPRGHVHQLPERDRGPAGDLPPGPRLSLPGHLRREQRPDPLGRPERLGWRRPDVLQPRRVRPDPLREEVAGLGHGQPDQGLGPAHDEVRGVRRVRLERPAAATTTRTGSSTPRPGRAAARATAWPTC